MNGLTQFSLGTAIDLTALAARAAEVPDPSAVSLTKILEVPNYCEGVVFDHDGYGYISHLHTITRFTPDGESSVWAVAEGARTGTRCLRMARTWCVMPVNTQCCISMPMESCWVRRPGNATGSRCAGPNDLTLDSKGGFYFTDPGGSATKSPLARPTMSMRTARRTWWLAAWRSRTASCLFRGASGS